MVKKFRKNKRGWIKVVEAFMAVLLVIGILLAVINNQSFSEFPEKKLDEKSLEILREISLDNSLREEVVSQVSLPINSKNQGFSSTLRNYVENKDELDSYCILQICEISSECLFTNTETNETAVSSKEMLISVTNNQYSPKKLKVFCYKNVN